jgi:hypothetical protein
MAEYRAVLVGRDAAPSKAFKMVKAELEVRGWQVDAFLGEGGSFIPDMDKVMEVVKTATCVLTGMSNPADRAEEEVLAADRAREAGVPFGFYADAPGRLKAEWFAHLREDASFLFVLNREERKDAEHIYRKAAANGAIFESGNHEWEDASFPKFSYDEIRGRLGIGKGEIMVLVPGHKSTAISAFLLVSTVHALNQPFVMKGRQWRVVFAPHPSDGQAQSGYKAYAEAVICTNVPAVTVTIVAKDKTYVRVTKPGTKEPEMMEVEGGFTTSDLLSGADLMVESASTFGQAAAIRQIPTISVLSEVSKIRNVPTFGKRDLYLVVQGVSEEVYGDANALAAKIIEVLTPEYKARVQPLQKALYPGFKIKGQFARIIANGLFSLVAKK